jgi:hypothetical protein
MLSRENCGAFHHNLCVDSVFTPYHRWAYDNSGIVFWLVVIAVVLLWCIPSRVYQQTIGPLFVIVATLALSLPGIYFTIKFIMWLHDCLA